MSERYCVKVRVDAINLYVNPVGLASESRYIFCHYGDARWALNLFLDRDRDAPTPTQVTIVRLKSKPKRKHWLAGLWVQSDSDKGFVFFQVASLQRGPDWVQLNDKGELP